MNSAILPFVQNQPLEDPTRSLIGQDVLELETVSNLNNLDNDNDCYLKECYCDKKCKGLRGLKAHQRSCSVLDLPELISTAEFIE